MLHKPTATECSQKPSAYPSIYTLLPAALRQRPSKTAIQGVQAVGRLDQDTTGLLLLSDDGQFIHRMSSPKKQVPKVYRVDLKHSVTLAQVQQLLAGVVLDDDPQPVKAHACEIVDLCTIDLTLTQGKYHQVKRMVAAVGNRVERLHRWRIGSLKLPSDLLPGQWRWLSPQDLGKLCITQHHLCFPYPFFHLVNFPSLRAQVFAHRQAFEALFSACTQFLGALMPSSPTALAATNAAPSTNCPAQTRCAAAACSSSDPGNAL